MDNYGLSISVEPDLEPVSLSEMKDWLRISNASEDAMIGALIQSARFEVENITRRSLINRTVVQTHLDFPGGDKLVLRASPVSSVTSIGYTDQAGDSQTFAASNYRVVTNQIRPFIRLVTGASWPTVETDNDGAVSITMIAGYGAVRTAVPDNARIALKMIVAYAYENRGDGRARVETEKAREIINMVLGPIWIVEF